MLLSLLDLSMLITETPFYVLKPISAGDGSLVLSLIGMMMTSWSLSSLSTPSIYLKTHIQIIISYLKSYILKNHFTKRHMQCKKNIFLFYVCCLLSSEPGASYQKCCCNENFAFVDIVIINSKYEIWGKKSRFCSHDLSQQVTGSDVDHPQDQNFMNDNFSLFFNFSCHKIT